MGTSITNEEMNMKLSECVAGTAVAKKRKCWEGGGNIAGTVLKRVKQLGVFLVVVLFEDGKERVVHPKNLYKA